MNKENQTKESPPPKSDLPVLTFPEELKTVVDIQEEIDKIEKQIEFYQKIRSTALRLTKEKDWIYHDKSLYLMDSGATSIAIAYGVSRGFFGEPIQSWHEDDDGRYYNFTAYGKAYSRKLGIYVEDIGTCSQRDKFFGRVGGQLKELEEVDLNMIKKKAATNCENRLIKALCGLKTVTEEELEEAGLDLSKIRVVEFGKGKEKAKKILSPEDLAIKDAIWKMAMILKASNEEEARLLVKKISTFQGTENGKPKTFFIAKMEDLQSPKWIRTIFENMKKYFRKQEPETEFPFDENLGKKKEKKKEEKKEEEKEENGSTD